MEEKDRWIDSTVNNLYLKMYGISCEKGVLFTASNAEIVSS